MYKIEKKLRDEIVAYLKDAVVPSVIGANLFQIATALEGLEPLLEETKEKK
jgi:hypothetical protein